METIFKGKTCIASYDGAKQRINFVFDGYANVEEHKDMYLEVLNFLKTNKTVAFMMDFRKMKGTFTMMNDWVIENLRPAIELGLTKNALILNDDVFTAFAANDALKKITLIQIQIFRNDEDAEKWLTE